MKIKSCVSFGSALLLSLSSFLVIITPSVHAATMTWDGGGSDNKLSTAENWVGDVAPTNSDSVDFPLDVVFGGGCSADVTLSNDLDYNTVTLAGISLSGTLPDGCSHKLILADYDFSVSGNISGMSQLTIQSDITVTAPIIITGTEAASLNIQANNITIDNSRFNGSISGTGKITITDNGGGKGGGCSVDQSNVFKGSGSGFTGTIEVVSPNGSLMVPSATTDFVRNASQISIVGDSYLSFITPFQADTTFDRPLTFTGTNIVNAMQSNDNGTPECGDITSNTTLVISSDVSFAAETTFYPYDVNIEFTGNVTGQDKVVLADGVSGSITFPDGTTIESKTLEYSINDEADCYQLYNSQTRNRKVTVNIDCSSSIGTDADYPLAISGILAGIGKIGHVEIQSGGVVAPGQSPGCLSTGNLAMVSGSTYDFEVGGTAECSEHDQIKVSGTVNLGGGTLNTISYNGFIPVAGQTYKIIDNDGSDAISGTFASLPEGATFTLGTTVLKISYVGGDGNDVVLSVTSSPATPDTGFNLLMNNPLITLLGTTGAAGGIALVARKQKKDQKTH